LRDYRAQRPTTGWLFTGESGKPLSDRNLIQRHVYPVAKRYMHELAGPKREAVQKIEKLILFPRKQASGE